MNVENIIHAVLMKTPVPFLNLNASELDLKFEVTQEGQQLTMAFSASFPIDFIKKSLSSVLEKALADALPEFTVIVTLESFIRAHKTQLAGKGLREVKNTIAVASGKGGVGKSTVTINLATALARSGARVGILDADIYGPSIPIMLGSKEALNIQDDRYLPIFAHGLQAMSIGYLTKDESALIWRGPMLAKALIQMLDITAWDSLDYLFIDLPPGTGDIQLSLVQKIPLTGAIIVTTPQAVATLDAEKAINLFSKTNIDVLGIIENMSSHVCSHCGHQEAIFSEGGALALAKRLQKPLLGQIPLDAKMVRHGDEGTPTASIGEDELAMTWMTVALHTAIVLGKKPLNYADKFPNIVVE